MNKSNLLTIGIIACYIIILTIQGTILIKSRHPQPTPQIIATSNNCLDPNTGKASECVARHMAYCDGQTPSDSLCEAFDQEDYTTLRLKTWKCVDNVQTIPNGHCEQIVSVNGTKSPWVCTDSLFTTYKYVTSTYQPFLDCVLFDYKITQ